MSPCLHILINKVSIAGTDYYFCHYPFQHLHTTKHFVMEEPTHKKVKHSYKNVCLVHTSFLGKTTTIKGNKCADAHMFKEINPLQKSSEEH